ncbi:hypothetical protein ACSBR1_016094 [Camellia fascicularis]
MVDFFYAFISIVVFSAVALFDQNVVKCFHWNPSDEAKELLEILPIGVGVICSLLKARHDENMALKIANIFPLNLYFDDNFHDT